jgi:hypothetical protein
VGFQFDLQNSIVLPEKVKGNCELNIAKVQPKPSDDNLKDSWTSFFSNMNYNCSILSNPNLRNLQEQVKKAFC